MVENRDQILFDAIKNFGTDNQMSMVIEECSELIQAICKIRRTFSPEQVSQIRKGTFKFESVSDALVYCNVCSEIADVKIMLGQLEKIFSPDHIYISEERKLIRLEAKIEKYKKDFADGNLKKNLTR